MNLFEVKGVILVAVDDKFTLEDRDGHKVEKKSIHRQFLNNYYNDYSGYKDVIENMIAEKGSDTEIAINIGDKIFVLFAYSTQGNRDDYKTELEYENNFIRIENSLKKVLNFCKEKFPNKIIHTAPIGTGVESRRTKKIISLKDFKTAIDELARQIGVDVEIISLE